MSEVDLDAAAVAARLKADREVELMYPGQRNTPDAQQAWSRIFWKEYRARVLPFPAYPAASLSKTKD